MSMLLLILFGVMLWVNRQEVRSLRARVDALEGWGGAPLTVAPRVIPAPEPERPAAAPDIALTSPPAPAVASRPVGPVGYAEPDAVARPAGTVPVGFEDVFGRRLPIWAGGLTLAVAGVLIVRYSIETGLLSPLVRVVLGLLFGVALIGGAELARRRDERVRDPRVRQALAGAGIATLYAVTLAAANLYGLIGPAPAFVGMVAVTVLAAALSLRFGAPSALLGLVGGLAAPALVGAGEPDVPLLTLYLALTVGGLCALGRQQRWWWLGGAALAGGFGWGALLIAGGVIDLAAALSVGAYTLGLAVALPMLLGGERAAAMRLAAAALGCAQIAAIVALGGYAPLHWGLLALLSVAILWLSRREPLFADVPALALGVAIMLALAWPMPDATGLALVLAGLAAIHALPAALRVWRIDARAIDAPMVAAVAASAGIVPAMHVDGTGWVTLVGAALAGAVPAVGWRAERRGTDARFAILAVTAAALLGMVGVQILPAAAWAPLAALLAAGSVALADAAADRRVERAGWLFGIVALGLLATDAGFHRLFGIGAIAHAAAWSVPAIAAGAMAWTARGERALAIQPAAVVLAYGAAAQVVPVAVLPLVPAAVLAALALSRRERVVPAAIAAGVVTLAWTIVPLSIWIVAATTAVTGLPVAVSAWPTVAEAVLRLAAPGLAVILAARLLPLPTGLDRAVSTAGAVLAAATTHALWRRATGIDTAEAMVVDGPMVRALWQLLLAGGAVTAWWMGHHRPALVFGAAALAHVVWFAGIVLNPLVVEQHAGPWLALSYGVAGGLLWAAPRVLPGVDRRRDGALMAGTVVVAFTLLRQASHAPMPLWAGTGAGEQIARSVLALVLAGGFLAVGIVRRARDWRLASLLLMLAAVAKVFLFDAAGLDGLARIASFAALGFSLIGVGWLYSRYLPEPAR